MALFSFAKKDNTPVILSLDSDLDLPPAKPGLSDGEIRAQRESVRDAIATVASQEEAEEEVRLEEIYRTTPFSLEDREFLVQAAAKRIKQQKMTLYHLQDIMEAKAFRPDPAARRHQELLNAIKDVGDQSVINKTTKFAQQHPFLAGIIGATIFDKLSRR